MYDLYAVLISAGCYGFIVVLRHVLERVWWPPATHSAWSSRSRSSPTSCMPCFAGSGC